jgi:O-antigen/teichoic acid export membrane protein
MTALVVVWILIQAPSLTDIIIYSVMSQVAVSAMIFYLYVIKWNSASLLEKNYTDNKILRNLGPKRAQFFTSNLGFVVSTYISVLLVGAYGSPEDAANLQIIVLIMNLVMVFPNAIYGKLLGFRVQQVAHKGEVKLSEVISQSAIMCLLGVVFTMVAVVTMNILIQLFFHEYNQIENFTLFLILSVIAVKYSGSYILAVFNYSNLILHKTMSQWFSIVLFVVLFYAVPLNDLVEKVLVATLVAEIIRLMLTGIKARSFFGKRANA